MKKHIGRASRNFDPATVYLDDVERVYEIISAHSENVTIKTDEFEYDDIKEFIEDNKKREKIYDLTISGHRPFASFSMTKNWASVSVNGNDENGMFERLSSTLEKCKWRLWFFRKGLFVFIYWVIVNFLVSNSEIAYSFLNHELVSEEVYNKTVSVLAISLLVWVAYWVWQAFLGSRAVLIMEVRGQQKNFFARNKDQLLVATIAAVFGGVIVLLVQRMM